MKKSALLLFIICEVLLSDPITIECENQRSVKIQQSIYRSLDGEDCRIIHYQNRPILFYYLNGMVNQCGVLLDQNKTDVYSQYFLSSEVCNIKIIKNILISTYRDQAQWVYRYFLINREHTILPLYGLTRKTLTQYNNIAFYLQKAGANEEAAYLLENIIRQFPDRTVAYYNLGDAYWALGEKVKAQKAYHTYIKQMQKRGLEKKIPGEVLKRAQKP